jgi:hypothetical protein
MAKTDNKEKHYFQGFEAGSDSFVKAILHISNAGFWRHQKFVSLESKKQNFLKDF